MASLAPDIFRKRLLIEGYFTIDIIASTLLDYFAHITSEMNWKTYGDPVVHVTSGKGKEINQGYDAFVPLIDSGIYIAVWSGPKFLSMIIYTCKDFNEEIAVKKTKEFFGITKVEYKIF